MVTIIKRVLIHSAYYLGFFKLWRYLNRDKLTIMTLHGVMSPQKDCTWEPLREQLPPETFEKSLKVLQKNYTFLSLSQAIDILEGKAPPVKNGIAFTFDDGYRNNITHALPVMKKFNVIPTFFVATEYLEEQKPFWFDHLDFSLQEAKGNGLKAEFMGETIEFDNSSRAALKESYAKFRSNCKGRFENDEVMLNAFDNLAKQLEAMADRKLIDVMKTDNWSGVMSWDELAKVSEAGEVEVGSHTLDHYRVDCLGEDEVRRQLKESKRVIEEKLGKECQIFCYPNGNFDDVSARIVKEAGYRAAVTTMDGLCAKGDDIVRLNRINFASTESVPLFNYLMSGLARK